MCIKIKNTYFNCALCFILELKSAVSRLGAAENSSGGSSVVRGGGGMTLPKLTFIFRSRFC